MKIWQSKGISERVYQQIWWLASIYNEDEMVSLQLMENLGLRQQRSGREGF